MTGYPFAGVEWFEVKRLQKLCADQGGAQRRRNDALDDGGQLRLGERRAFLLVGRDLAGETC